MATTIDTRFRDGNWVGAPSVEDVEANVDSVTLLDDSDSPYDVSVDEAIILADATSDPITLNLPAAADAAGMVLCVKKTGTGVNAVTLDPNASEQIDGGGTYADLDAAGDVVEIVCDGTEWHILNSTIA